MKNSMIDCIALKPLKIGHKEHDRPPSSAQGRLAQYSFKLPSSAVAALAKAGKLRPLYEQDSYQLHKETGYRCAPYVAGPTPKVDQGVSEAPEPEPEPEAAPADSSDETLTEKALRTKLKADLVEALEAEGLDPANYSNNAERIEALEGLG
jgi:hypothetical protein